MAQNVSNTKSQVCACCGFFVGCISVVEIRVVSSEDTYLCILNHFVILEYYSLAIQM